MSGIAEVLLNLGYKVSGSDLRASPAVERLASLGAKIFLGHEETNVQNADIAVYSSAVTAENPEFQAAAEKGIPIIKRAEMLAELMRLKFGIAVAGSHGKTTTTSFLATVLSNLNYEPTYIVGGVVKNLGSNAGIGRGDYLVAEADESDGSFLCLNPIISVITNIDNDHLDFYKSEEALLRAFADFANKIPFYGHLIINGHDPQIGKILKKIKRPVISFGLKGKFPEANGLDYLAANIRREGEGLAFDLEHAGESVSFKIRMHGEHNVLNALGAVIAAHKLGAGLEEISTALSSFEGVGRRLETLMDKDNVAVIDDYGHHPTEIAATLAAVKERYAEKEINVVFEPHRYTRSENFWSEFVEALTGDFKVYILPVYSAGEKAVPYIDSEVMVKNINENGGNAKHIKSLAELETDIFSPSKSEKLYLTLGAGSIGRQIRELL